MPSNQTFKITVNGDAAITVDLDDAFTDMTAVTVDEAVNEIQAQADAKVGGANNRTVTIAYDYALRSFTFIPTDITETASIKADSANALYGLGSTSVEIDVSNGTYGATNGS